jgi:HEAT repeat protein
MVQVSFWSSLAHSLGIQSAGSAREAAIRRHIANLSHPIEDTRRSAAWSLGKMGAVPEEAVKALQEMAKKDPSHTARKAAKWALKSLGVDE